MIEYRLLFVLHWKESFFNDGAQRVVERERNTRRHPGLTSSYLFIRIILCEKRMNEFIHKYITRISSAEET